MAGSFLLLIAPTPPTHNVVSLVDSSSILQKVSVNQVCLFVCFCSFVFVLFCFVLFCFVFVLNSRLLTWLSREICVRTEQDLKFVFWYNVVVVVLFCFVFVFVLFFFVCFFCFCFCFFFFYYYYYYFETENLTFLSVLFMKILILANHANMICSNGFFFFLISLLILNQKLLFYIWEISQGFWSRLK